MSFSAAQTDPRPQSAPQTAPSHPRKSALFARFPLDHRITVASESLTSPYHVYDGTMLCLNGTVDRDVAAELLAREGLSPLVDTKGRALAAVWVCDFAKANLGAHHELQISLFAGNRDAPPLPAHPFSFFRALANRPDLKMVCHGLWNDIRRVVRYNTEHLRLDAAMTRCEVRLGRGRGAFRFLDEDGALIAEGAVGAGRGTPAGQGWRIVGQMGLGGLLRVMQTPAINIPVVNTRRREARNHVCQTYTTCERAHVRLVETDDVVAIRHQTYEPLHFKPAFVLQFDGVGFIFLRPKPLA